jgi:hypothetical protein
MVELLGRSERKWAALIENAITQQNWAALIENAITQQNSGTRRFEYASSSLSNAIQP